MQEDVVWGRKYYNIPMTFTDMTMTSRNGEAPSQAYSEGSSPGTGTISVNVKVENPANRDAAIEAAKNLVLTLSTIIDAASSIMSYHIFTLPDGKLTTAGQLLQNAKITKFTVSDKKTFGNSGIGTADRISATDLRDEIYFGGLVGPDSYAASTYPNSQGLVGIILHELGHLSAEGKSVYDTAIATWSAEMRKRRRKVPQDQFYLDNEGQIYAKSIENYAHGYGAAAALAINLDISTYNTTVVANKLYGPFMSAADIQKQNLFDNPIG